MAAGYANVAVTGSGVTSVIFHATQPANSDFALAAIEVVPLPAAGLLLGTALAGLGWLRRRRRRRELRTNSLLQPPDFTASPVERARELSQRLTIIAWLQRRRIRVGAGARPKSPAPQLDVPFCIQLQ